MKKFYKNQIFMVICFFLISGLALNLNAQEPRYVDVAPGIGTLSTAIMADTTEDGARVDSFNTIYRLERKEDIYLIDQLITNIDWPLTVVAADGDGPMPFLQLKTDENGDNPEYCFRPKGDFTIQGLHMTNKDDLGGVENRIIRCSADGIKIRVDNCWLDDAGQSAFRFDNEDISLFMTNSVMSNIGHPNNPNNGRGIDDRGNNIDTIVFENNTFYNITSRIIRDGGGWIKYCKMDQNTIVNTGQMCLSFGEIAGLDFTNNILRNAAFLATDTASGWYIFEIDSIGSKLDSLGFTQTINITNNSLYRDTSLIEAYLNDTTVIVPMANETAMAFMMMNPMMVYYQENVEFVDPPGGLQDFVDHQADPTLDPADADDWDNPDPPNTIYHLATPYDFGYVNSVLNNGSTMNTQMGDLNWEASNYVGVAPRTADTGGLSVYPMPVHNQMTIGFSLDRAANVNIEVYNLVGSRVASYESGYYQAGSHTIAWDVSDRFETGMYILRMNAGNKSLTTKMIVE